MRFGTKPKARSRRAESAALVLPVARFPFRNPFDGASDASLTRFLALRLGDPLRVFPLVAGRKFLERRRSFLVLP